MRVRLSGSTITAHGDNLGTPYVEFPGNEPTGFPTNWTVSGSSPTRKLVDPNGHEYSVELPTQTAPGGGSGVTVDNGSDPPAAVTTLVAPGAVIAGDQATLLFWTLRSKQITHSTPNLGTGVVCFSLAAGEIIYDAWVEVTTIFDGADNHLTIAHTLGHSLFWDDPVVGTVSIPENVTGGLSSNLATTAGSTGPPQATLLSASADGIVNGVLRPVPARVLTGGNLVATFYDPTGVSQGDITVVAIIATPAS